MVDPRFRPQYHKIGGGEVGLVIDFLPLFIRNFAFSQGSREKDESGVKVKGCWLKPVLYSSKGGQPEGRGWLKGPNPQSWGWES